MQAGPYTPLGKVTPHLTNAVETIAVAPLSAVVDSSAPRSAHVLRAIEEYRPYHGGLAPFHAQTGRDLVEEALQGLDPRMVVNRQVSDAVDLLDNGSFTVRNVMEDTTGQYTGALKHWDLLGPDLGLPVFGSLQFFERGALASAVPTPHSPTIGAASYGPVANVMRASALDDATFLAADMYQALQVSTHTAAKENLVDVAFENVLHHYGLLRGRVAERAARPHVVGSDEYPVMHRAAAADFYRLILGEHDAAVRDLRSYFTGPSLRGEPLIEVHRARLGTAEIDTIFLEAHHFDAAYFKSYDRGGARTQLEPAAARANVRIGVDPPRWPGIDDEVEFKARTFTQELVGYTRDAEQAVLDLVPKP